MEKPRYVGELMKQLGVEQSCLSHHLALLREARLVDARREGQSVLYQLAEGVEGTALGQSLNLGCCQLTFPARKKSSRRR